MLLLATCCNTLNDQRDAGVAGHQRTCLVLPRACTAAALLATHRERYDEQVERIGHAVGAPRMTNGASRRPPP